MDCAIHRTAWTLAATFGLACARPDATPRPPVATDSGVAVVENAAARWSDRSAWRVDSVPFFDVGGSDRDSSRMFSNIRGVHALSNRSVAVLDESSHSILFFNSTGALIGRVGRKGSGPGEFPGQIYRSFSCGTDSVYVFLAKRILVFAAPGTYVREFEMTPAVGRYAEPVLCQGDQLIGTSQIGAPPAAPGVHPDTVVLARYDLSGKSLAVIDTLQNMDRTYTGARGAETGGNILSPYGNRAAFALGAAGLVTARTDTLALSYRDSTGRVRRVVRFTDAAAPRRPLDAAEGKRFRDFVTPKLAGASDGADIADLLKPANLPATIPAFAELRMDRAGNLWVRAYDFADAVEFFDRVYQGAAGFVRQVHPEQRRWTVLDPDGVLLGDVTLPPRFDVHDIGPDWILGVWRDAVDVEHVRMYRLIKP